MIQIGWETTDALPEMRSILFADENSARNAEMH
jgi:hypothetical protein